MGRGRGGGRAGGGGGGRAGGGGGGGRGRDGRRRDEDGTVAEHHGDGRHAAEGHVERRLAHVWPQLLEQPLLSAQRDQRVEREEPGAPHGASDGHGEARQLRDHAGRGQRRSEEHTSE